MITIRKANPAFADGSYKTISNDNDHVFTFMRKDAGQTILVAINLADKESGATIDANGKPVNIIGDAKPVVKGEKLAVNLPAFGVGAWELK
jgi:glycosidase